MSALGPHKLVAVAIDFGTTYSGYAFSLTADFEKDPLHVSTPQAWIAGKLMSQKTSTSLLMDPNKEFHSFGYEAEDHYHELAFDDKHRDWFYFRRFKMVLHNKSDLNRDTTIEDETGKTMAARDVFAYSIRFLKNHATETLQTRGSGIEDDDIHWILTVPAIWSDASKQFMREAAQKAGIENPQLSIALEPEAASVYCKHLPVNKLMSSAHSGIGVFEPGTKYMIIDLGGGTADITVHRVEDDDSLTELHCASGGAWGGTKVDEAFVDLLRTLVGDEVMERFGRDHKYDAMDLLREFETVKRTIKTEMGDKVRFKVPVALTQLYTEMTGKQLKEAIMETEHAGKISWIADKVSIDSNLMRKLFQFSLDTLVEHIREVLAEHPVRGTRTFLLVGGFSESPLVQETIRRKFSNMRIISPPDAGLSVLKGAVIYGHQPLMVMSRVCRFTYGIAINRIFAEKEDPGEKRIESGGRVLCKDVFHKYAEQGQSMKVGDFQVCMPYRATNDTQSLARVRVFKSKSKCPSFVTDPSCSLLGEVIINLPQEEKCCDCCVDVRMSFSGTEIAVEATETSSGRTSRARFDFLNC